MLNRIELLAAHSPDPAGTRAALASFEQRQPAAFQRVAHSTAALQYLIAVFSQSNFLTQEILDAPECLEQLLSDGDLHRVRTTEEYRARLVQEIDPNRPPDPLPFARFRRQQILRILIRDVLGFGGLSDVTAELSALADAIVETAYHLIHGDMVLRYGYPCAETGEPAHFAVIALGKLGGEELNYSSDIDLMFLYSGEWGTEGRRRASPTRNFSNAQPISLRRCFPPTRRRACATAWTCACGPKEVWARSASRSKGRASITKRGRAIGNCR